ncbi:MAG: hypothetical protein HY398_01060 [Candidatus Doudnabacteria bacterium]|nr:hypothetical protein [Candidatus Doudnabacteria bacterium]
MTKSFLRDRLIFVSLLIAFFVNIILWAVLLGKFGFAGRSIPLHYNVVSGVDFVNSSRRVYQLPLAGLLIFFVNVFLGRLLYDREKLLGYVLIFAAAAAQGILLVAGVALATLNR